MQSATKLMIAAAAVIAVAAFVGVAPEVQAVCEDCYGIWTGDAFGNTYHDAQCCFSDSYLCDNLAQDGWNLDQSNLQYCSTFWRDGYGYVCSGTTGCDSGGGGGGGGCTTGPGEYCPTWCVRCTPEYY